MLMTFSAIKRRKTLLKVFFKFVFSQSKKIISAKHYRYWFAIKRRWMIFGNLKLARNGKEYFKYEIFTTKWRRTDENHQKVRFLFLRILNLALKPFYYFHLV